MRRKLRGEWLCLGLLAISACRSRPPEDAFEANVPLHPRTGDPAVISLHFEPGMSVSRRTDGPRCSWRSGRTARFVGVITLSREDRPTPPRKYPSCELP